MSGFGTELPKRASRAESALPGGSDVNLLGDGEGIVDLDAEIPHGALDFGVTQQQLDGTQISCTRVDTQISCSRADECRFGPAKRMRAKETRVQSDTCEPARDKLCVLPCCDAAVLVAPARE